MPVCLNLEHLRGFYSSSTFQTVFTFRCDFSIETLRGKVVIHVYTFVAENSECGGASLASTTSSPKNIIHFRSKNLVHSSYTHRTLIVHTSSNTPRQAPSSKPRSPSRTFPPSPDSAPACQATTARAVPTPPAASSASKAAAARPHTYRYCHSRY